MSDFDITQHEWSDSDINCNKKSDHLMIESNAGLSGFFLEEADAIAIAKHFGLTAEDLE